MEYTYKFRIYPNASQMELIEKTFGCVRFVYNHYLDMRISKYKDNNENLNYYDCSRDLTKLKKELLWLKEVDATALQSSLKDLDTAYKNFFREHKGFPNFKSKHNNYHSYTCKMTIKILDNKYIQLPKLDKVRCKISKQVQGKILHATVSKKPSGKYYVSVCCSDVDIHPLEKTNKSIGIDLGIKDLLITSDGYKYPNHKYITNSEKKLARLQRQLSRKSNGSNNKNKARIKVAKLHEHIVNQRLDNLHKVTTELVRKYDVICIEDLNANGMIKNHKLAKSIADVSFGELRRQLEYKAMWYGKTISVIDRFFPSSQLCSACGFQNSSIKDLAIRKWKCPNCQVTHDRDKNAATNILNEGLKQIA